jgi:hypothetical protein
VTITEFIIGKYKSIFLITTTFIWQNFTFLCQFPLKISWVFQIQNTISIENRKSSSCLLLLSLVRMALTNRFGR